MGATFLSSEIKENFTLVSPSTEPILTKIDEFGISLIIHLIRKDHIGKRRLNYLICPFQKKYNYEVGTYDIEYNY